MTTAVYAADRRFFEVSALDAASLPPLPVDLRDRHVRWVMIAGEPGVYYSPTGYAEDAEWVDMDAAWMARAIEQHEALRAQGYTPPIRAQHEPGLSRHGDVLQLATWTDPADGRLKLLAALAFADPDAPDKIARGEYAWASMGVGGYVDEQKVEYRDAILEVSLVDAPYHKHLSGGRPGHILKEAAMADKPEDKIDAAPEMGGDKSEDKMPGNLDELRELMRSEFEALVNASRAQAMESSDDDDAESMDGGDAEDDDDAPATEMSASAPSAIEVELRERIATLERDKLRAEYRAAAPIGATLTVTPELVAHLFSLRCADAEAHDAIARAFVLPSEQPASPPAKPSQQFGDIWGKRLGHSGGAPSEEVETPPKPTTPAEVKARKKALYDEAMREADGDAKKARAIYAARCHAESLNG